MKTLNEFEFKFQPSIDHKLVRELTTERFIAGAENVLMVRTSRRWQDAPGDRTHAERQLHPPINDNYIAPSVSLFE